MSILGRSSVVNTVRSAYRKRRLDTNSTLVATYRCSTLKPEKIYKSKVELFYRPRIAWTIVQILAISAVAIWTVRNYVHIIKSL